MFPLIFRKFYLTATPDSLVDIPYSGYTRPTPQLYIRDMHMPVFLGAENWHNISWSDKYIMSNEFLRLYQFYKFVLTRLNQKQYSWGDNKIILPNKFIFRFLKPMENMNFIFFNKTLPCQ